MTDNSLNKDLNESNKYPDNLRDGKTSSHGILNNNSNLQKINIGQTVLLQKRIEETHLDDLGKIENAKKHRSANRPLHKLRDFNNNVNFCSCCNLPCEEKGIIEPFKFCDDIDKFSECGLGVSLYYYFFQFVLLITFIAICIMAVSMMVFNHHYTKGINRVCNSIYFEVGINNISRCSGFVTVAEENLNLYSRFNDWVLRFTSDNLYIYWILHEEFSGTDYAEKVIINYSWLNFFFLLSIFILNVFYIVFIEAHSQKARLSNLSIRNYTVLISNTKHILMDYLKSKGSGLNSNPRNNLLTVENTEDFIKYVNKYIRYDKSLMDLNIYNINMCYDLGNFMENRKNLDKCKLKIFRINNNPVIIKKNSDNGKYGKDRHYYMIPLGPIHLNCIAFKGKTLAEIEAEKRRLESLIDSEKKKIEIINDQNFTGYMFVSFDKISDKEHILEKYPNNFFDFVVNFFKDIKYYICCCCISEGEKIKISRKRGIDVEDPPEPEDLYWENFKFNKKQRCLRIFLCFLFCFIIIAISFGIVLLFTYAQEKIMANERSLNLFAKYLLSALITLVIVILNLILESILTKLTGWEKHLSRTSFYLSLSIKLTIFTFLNSAIIPLLSKTIIISEKHVPVGQTKNDIKIDRNNLLVNDMLLLFVVNAIFTPIIWTFHPKTLYKRFRIYLIEKSKDPDNNHFMTQQELNKLYELSDMRIAYKYSYLTKTIAMALFYMPIFPMGFIISLLGFVLGYILELYNFTHIYKRPDMLDEIITRIYANNFIVVLFIGGIGDYIFLHNTYPENKISLVNIILFGILIIIPFTKFMNCNYVGKKKSEFQNYPLSKIHCTLYNDYQRQNPLTKKYGLLNYLNELKNNDLLSDNAYKLAEDNIDKVNLMELYYRLSRRDIQMHQSAIANMNKSGLAQTLRKSLLGQSLKENQEEKKKTKEMFESQIYSVFGNQNFQKQSINEPLNTIYEENENENQFNSKETLINTYNKNPFGITTGFSSLVKDDNICNDIPITTSKKQSINNEINNNNNIMNNSLSFEDKREHIINISTGIKQYPEDNEEQSEEEDNNEGKKSIPNKTDMTHSSNDSNENIPHIIDINKETDENNKIPQDNNENEDDQDSYKNSLNKDNSDIFPKNNGINKEDIDDMSKKSHNSLYKKVNQNINDTNSNNSKTQNLINDEKQSNKTGVIVDEESDNNNSQNKNEENINQNNNDEVKEPKDNEEEEEISNHSKDDNTNNDLNNNNNLSIRSDEDDNNEI